MNSAHTPLNEILTPDEIASAWGPQVVALPNVSFSSNDVPEGLHVLTPYAEIWGVSDDLVREGILKRTPKPLKENLKRVVELFDDQLDFWLSGPEASSTNPSDAYVAFSAMRMAADYV